MAGKGFKEEKKPPAALNLTLKRSDSSSTDNSLKVPRTPRFAEATSVNSPVDMDKSPFADPEKPETGDSQQPGVVGFGYISNTLESSNGPKSPLKSAMKVPGTPARQFTNPLSPTFREEEVLEKREAQNDQQQANDVRNLSDIEESSPFTPGDNVTVNQPSFPSPQPGFKLQAPPVKAPSATPKTIQAAFSPTAPRAPSPPATSAAPQHAPQPADEPTYESVPIPGAYAGQAIKSPPPHQTTFGQAI